MQKEQRKSSRPKRRRRKDNPYELLVIDSERPAARYYVRFKNAEGEFCVQIEKDIFDLLDSFEREDLRILNEYDRHYEHREQTEQSINRRSAIQHLSVEETVLKRMEYSELHTAIRRLSDKQRRRLSLHYFGGYKIKEIAEMEGCDPSVISRSISAAEKKLKKILSE